MKERIWVVVADAAGARIFRADPSGRRLELECELAHPEGRAKPSELVADRPGRSLDSSRTGARHAMEPDTDPARAELQRFARRIAQELDANRSAFDALILVAGPRLLGLLRAELTEPLRQRTRAEVAKDLAHADPSRLLEELTPILRR